MMKTAICPICNQEFSYYSSQKKKHCSWACYRKAQGDRKKVGICPVCSKEFTYYPSCYDTGVKIYCSRKCQRMDARIGSVCPYCGKTFWYHRSWPRKFCSKKCASLANRNWENSPGRAIQYRRYCEQCGKEITQPSKSRGSRFCSLGCYGKWVSLAAGPRPDLQNRVTIKCQQCNKIFKVKASQASRRKFCSIECRNKHWRESGKYAGANNPNFKGGYEPYYGPNWLSQRRNARHRDNYTCQRCGITEKEYARQLDVHHIIPFRQFGLERYKEANILKNLICYCNVCHLIIEPQNGIAKEL